jgi:chromosome segregation ATPase
MPSRLRNLINDGEISAYCLRCHERLEHRDFAAGRRVLGELKAQDFHNNPDFQYQLALYTLANCSFCRSCAMAFPQKIKDYRLELMKCLADESGAAKEATPVSESGETKTETQKRKDRRTCPPAELLELAKQIKQLERESDGLKKRISVLKQELQTERSQREQLQRKHDKLQHTHTQMLEVGTKKYNEMIAEGTTRIAELNQRNADMFAEGTTRIAELNKQNADLTAEANAKFTELMQKIAGLESQNSWIREQMRTQDTIDKKDIAKMVGTIKELNAGLVQCRGERYKIWLTPTSRHVVNTLEPMYY